MEKLLQSITHFLRSCSSRAINNFVGGIDYCTGFVIKKYFSKREGDMIMENRAMPRNKFPFAHILCGESGYQYFLGLKMHSAQARLRTNYKSNVPKVIAAVAFRFAFSSTKPI